MAFYGHLYEFKSQTLFVGFKNALEKPWIWPKCSEIKFTASKSEQKRHKIRKIVRKYTNWPKKSPIFPFHSSKIARSKAAGVEWARAQCSPSRTLCKSTLCWRARVLITLSNGLWKAIGGLSSPRFSCACAMWKWRRHHSGSNSPPKRWRQQRL